VPLTTEVTSAIVKNVAKPAMRDVVEKNGEEAVVKAFGQDTRQGGMVNHAVFFDTNFDRKISLTETRQGLQDLNFGQKISYLLAPVANLVLGEGVRAEAGASFWYRLKHLFTVDLDKLAASAAKETGGHAIDPVARVASQMKFDTGNKGALTLDEIGKWVDAEHPGGKNGRTKLGFKQLFQVGADTTKVVTVDGKQVTVPAMSKEALEHFYEGSLFYDIAARNGHPHPLPPAK
jgi:hypothetical protein